MSEINGVTPKEAESKKERYLLGIVAKKQREIHHGTIMLAVTFKEGQLDFVSVEKERETFKM